MGLSRIALRRISLYGMRHQMCARILGSMRSEWRWPRNQRAIGQLTISGNKITETRCREKQTTLTLPPPHHHRLQGGRQAPPPLRLAFSCGTWWLLIWVFKWSLENAIDKFRGPGGFSQGAREGFKGWTGHCTRWTELYKAKHQNGREKREKGRLGGVGTGREGGRETTHEELEGDSNSDCESDRQPESLRESRSIQPIADVVVIPSLDTLHDCMVGYH